MYCTLECVVYAVFETFVSGTTLATPEHLQTYPMDPQCQNELNYPLLAACWPFLLT